MLVDVVVFHSVSFGIVETKSMYERQKHPTEDDIYDTTQNNPIDTILVIHKCHKQNLFFLNTMPA